jgi:glycine/D-amino acid oxidase-like deaminating enzyme
MTFMARPMVVGRGYSPAVDRHWTDPSHAPTAADVVVIGGGIVGCAAAAIMADRGAAVVLVEATAIGAGASGRNLGAIQHPFDHVLAPLYAESLARYRALASLTEYGFAIGAEPAGLLLLTPDLDAATAQVGRMQRAFPDLAPTLIGPHELEALEPSLAAGFSAVRLETGFPVPPAAATIAWAALAEDRGAAVVVGAAAQPLERDGRVAGVELGDGSTIGADSVLVAAGPWTPRLVDPSGTWRPIHPTWGVTIQLRLDGRAPRHIVEEDEVDALSRAETATARADAMEEPDADPPSLFSLATAGGVTTLGSTFLPVEPDPARIASLLLRRAAAFLPAVVEAELLGRRMCARPQSLDGRPFIGAVPQLAGLFVCAGHGPWGISTGPASAAIAARAILDGTKPPAELEASRLS